MNAIPVITIDGPSGAGKGTVSRAVAEALGWHFLDSGALYRVLALAAERAGLSAAVDVAAIAGDLQIHFNGDQISLDGEDVSHELRTEETGNAASRIAVEPEVRSALISLQRSFRRPPGLVADGRDMGTVIFPDATCKIFLTANAEERAGRRYKQLKEKGLNASLDDLFQDIAKRDARDARRKASPLCPAADAVVIDTTGISVEDVVQRVLAEADRAGYRAT